MIFLVTMEKLFALDYIETLRISQGLGLNLGLEEVYFKKASSILSCESNPNPYDFSSGLDVTRCISQCRDKMKITRVRVE